MGNILVADLQGKLTIDKRLFSEGLAQARQETAGLKADLDAMQQQIPALGQQLGGLSVAHQQAQQMVATTRELAHGGAVTPTSGPIPVPPLLGPNLQAGTPATSAATSAPPPTYNYPPPPAGVMNYPAGIFPGGQAPTYASTPQYLAGTDAQQRVAQIKALNPGMSDQDVADLLAATGLGSGAASVVQPLGAPRGPIAPASVLAAPPTIQLPQPSYQTTQLPTPPVAAPGGAPPAQPPTTTPPTGSLASLLGGGGAGTGGGGGNQPPTTGLYPFVQARPRGEPGSILYQEYQARENPLLNLGERFLGAAGAPQLGIEALGGLVSPFLATAAAVTAFGEVIKSATEAAEAYAASQFQLTEENKNNFLGTSGGQNILASERNMLQPLGVGGTDANNMLDVLTRYTQSQTEMSRDLKDAMDFARQFGVSPQQSLQMIIGATQMGQSGAFTQYIPQIRDNEAPNYVLQQIEQRTGGAAQRFTETPAGRQAVAGAELGDEMTKLGQAFLPLSEDFIKLLHDMMPAFDAAIKGVTAFGEALGWVVDHVLHPLGFAGGGGGTPPTPFPGQRPTTDVQTSVDYGGRNFAPGVFPGGPMRLPGTVASGIFSQPTNLAPLGSTGQLGAGTSGVGTDPAIDANAFSQLTAMRQISEEVASSETAISGVAKVFAELTTFHVDFTQVKGSLDNLKQAVVFLEQFWIDVATSESSKIQQNFYGYAKTWLDMVGSMVTTMSDAADMLSKLYQTSGEIPAEGQMAVVLDRVNTTFKMVATIADEAFKQMNAGGQAQQGLEAFKTGAWANAVQSIEQMMTLGSDMLTAIYSAPVPSPDMIQNAAERTVFTIATLADDLYAEFMKLDANDAIKMIFGGGSGPQISSTLANAAAMAQPGSTLLNFMMTGANLFHAMTNLYVPSPAEVSTVVERSMGVVDQIAGAIATRQQTSAGPNASVGAFPGLPNLADILPPQDTSSDPTLKAAGDRAENMQKILGVAQSGVAALQGMRNLPIPSPEEIKTVMTDVFKLSDDIMAMIPAQTSDQANIQAKAKAWGDSFGPVYGAIASGVQALQGMRNLPIPSPGEMGAVTTRLHDLQDSFAGAFSMDADTAAKVQQGGAAMASVFGAIGSGVTALKDMRNLEMPTPQEMADLNTRVKGMKVDFAGAFSMGPTQADDIKQGGDALNAVFGALGSAVGVLRDLRDLAEPTVGMMQDFKAHMTTLRELFASSMAMDANTADAINQGAGALNAVYGALSAGADALNKIFNLPLPTQQEMVDFKTRMTQAMDQWEPIAAATSQHLGDRMKDWGLATQAMFEGLSAAADYEQKIVTLYVPSKDQMDAVFEGTKYMADKATTLAESISPDLAKTITTSATALADEFQALNAGADLIAKVATTPLLSQQMVSNYFRNLDEFTTAYAQGMKDWVAKQDFANQQYSKALGDELTALAAGTDFLSKLGTLRPDYSNAIHGYFEELTQVVASFAAESGVWFQQVTPLNAVIAKNLGTELDALNSGMTLLSDIPKGAVVRPDQIAGAFSNIRVIVKDLVDLEGSMPELQGDARTGLVAFAGNIGEIFGAIKTTVEAVNLLSQPGTAESTQNFGAAMNTFFLHSVPAYADEWINQMNRMASGSENMADRTYNAMASTPPGQMAGMKPVTVRPVQSAAPVGAGGAGGGGNYTNCIFIGQDLIASDPDVANLIMKLTQQQTVKNGGLNTSTSNPGAH